MSEGTLKKVKDYCVDLVNPKFKTFNRPLLLAMLVGVVTYAIAFAIYSSMMTNCSLESFMGTRMLKAFERVQAAGGNPVYDCVMRTEDLNTRCDGPQFDDWEGYKARAGVSDTECISGTAANALNPNAPCTTITDYNHMRATTLIKDFPSRCIAHFQACVSDDSRINYCDDSPFKNAQVDVDPDPDEPDGDPMKKCGSQTLMAEWDVGGKPMLIEYRSCPDPQTTLGAALGYTTTIEMFVTVIILVIFMSLGVVKKDNMTMKQAIQDALNEEDDKDVEKGSKGSSKVAPASASSGA